MQTDFTYRATANVLAEWVFAFRFSGGGRCELVFSSVQGHTAGFATGIPRISKVRDLVDDRRFTLADAGGNTLYIGSPMKDRFFRSLEHGELARRFAVLYDVLHSKEDPAMAAKILPKYTDMKDLLTGLDKARFLLLELDIQKQTAQPLNDGALVMLMDSQAETGGD